MHAMKEARAVWIVIAMISNYMAGMELYGDNFNGLSTICSIVGLLM